MSLNALTMKNRRSKNRFTFRGGEISNHGFTLNLCCICPSPPFLNRFAYACFFYQEAVEEDVDKHSQTADDEVNEVVEELKIHNHGFVATREGSAIPHETDQEDDFVTYLKSKNK